MSENHNRYRAINPKILLFGLLITLTPPVKAQQAIDVPHEYPFIRYNANHLHYDTSSASMRHFFHKWNLVVDAMQGNVNIVHIGSSHVQGGSFPNRVRYNFMSELPDLVADRGMLFPYSAAAKCNNPPDYAVHCPERVELTRCVYAQPAYDLGLCGIAITAHDTPTHIDIAIRPTHIDYATRRVIVLGYSPDEIIPLLGINGREIPPSYIDTATRRYIFNLSETTDSVQVILPCSAGTSFTLTGVYLGNRQSGFSYHSIGVNGASLADYAKCIHFADDLRLLNPDLVIFGIGINDASGPNFDTTVFFNRYMVLIEKIRALNPSCAFIFITNNDSFRATGRKRRRRYTVNNNGPLARDVAYRLAKATGGAVWDQFEIMGGLKSMEKWCKAGLAQRDHVHFTPTGYTLLGDLLYNAIIEAYQNTPKERLENKAGVKDDKSNKEISTNRNNESSAKNNKSNGVTQARNNEKTTKNNKTKQQTDNPNNGIPACISY